MKQDLLDYLVKNGKDKSWDELAERFSVTSGEAARAIWRKYRKRHGTSKSNVKILLLDIETAPVKAYVWRLWKQDIYIDQIISEWFMLTWSAKWLFDDEVFSNRLSKEEVLVENDKRIVENLRELLQKADIVIGHNCKSFDVPKINARMLIHNLAPTTFYHQIDTKEVACKQFGFSSNKLDALAHQFGFEPKKKTDFSLWVKCLAGEDESLRYMEEYNRHDVELLEEVYLKLRPWIKNHPSLSLYGELNNKSCTNCGSEELTPEGHYYTTTGKFVTHRCSCGALSRERVGVKMDKTNLLMPIGK